MRPDEILVLIYDLTRKSIHGLQRKSSAQRDSRLGMQRPQNYAVCPHLGEQKKPSKPSRYVSIGQPPRRAPHLCAISCVTSDSLGVTPDKSGDENSRATLA